MTQILFDVLLVGVVVFSAVRKIGKRPAADLGNDPPAPAEQRTGGAARGEPLETRPPKRVAAATVPILTSRSIDPPHYVLGAQHAGATRDRMAETLAMMSGPGLCTPRSS